MQPNNRKQRRAPARDALLTLPLKNPLAPVRGPVKPVIETKYLDIAQTAYVCDTTGTITLLNGIAEGDDNVNRNGRRVAIKDVAVSGYSTPTFATGVPQQHRFLLVWDNATNGAAPTIAAVLSAANTTAFPNPDGANRFTVLWDHTQVLGKWTSTIVDQVIKQFSATLRVGSATQFQGTGATVASVQNGGLFMITLGSEVAGTTAGSSQVSTRVTFHEIQ